MEVVNRGLPGRKGEIKEEGAERKMLREEYVDGG